MYTVPLLDSTRTPTPGPQPSITTDFVSHGAGREKGVSYHYCMICYKLLHYKTVFHKKKEEFGQINYLHKLK